jgi:hypothetical protein
MAAMEVRKLDDSQVEAFDTEYVGDALWSIIRRNIELDFGDGEFTFLDVGGGNGRFADRVLSEYPRSRGTVLDNSEVLLARNRPNERKGVLLESVENLDRISARCDIVFLNWFLHRVVLPFKEAVAIHDERCRPRGP